MPLIFLLATAAASTLVVLPLDARGVDAESADAATEALRDALTAEGAHDIPRATELATALTAGHEADLRRARELLAAGRAAAGKGDITGAVASLSQAVTLHLAAGSATARRGELADVLWLLAETRLRAGDTLHAREDLTGVAQLWPGYARSRGRGATGTASRMLSEIEGGLAKEAWQVDGDVVDATFRAASPEWVVAGAIDGSGAVTLHVLGSDGADWEVDEVVPLPVDAAAAEWTGLAERVERATHGGSAARPRAVAAAEVPAYEPEAPEEPEEAEAPVEPPRRPVVEARPAERVRSQARADKPVTIRGVRSSEDPNRPVTSRWWFWTAIVGVAGGGTALGVVLAEPAPVVVVREDAHYSVTVSTD